MKKKNKVKFYKAIWSTRLGGFGPVSAPLYLVEREGKIGRIDNNDVLHELDDNRVKIEREVSALEVLVVEGWKTYKKFLHDKILNQQEHNDHFWKVIAPMIGKD